MSGCAGCEVCELAEELAAERALAAKLTEAFGEYAAHQSWRCGHPDRYPWTPDCPCGLTATMRELGVEAIACPEGVIEGG